MHLDRLWPSWNKEWVKRALAVALFVPAVQIPLACSTPDPAGDEGSSASADASTVSTSDTTDSQEGEGEATGEADSGESGETGDDTGCTPGALGCECATGNTCATGNSCIDGTCEPPSCGNGVVEGDEECDVGDANLDTGVCKTNCEAETCGDGFVGPNEGCDDMNDVPDDGCDACILATCGDGIVNVGEECDDGNEVETDSCLSNCRDAVCGDGEILDVPGTVGDEECDFGASDGSTNTNGDGNACRNDCVYTTCGDGYVGGPEVCDDGNQDDTDACNNNCQLPTCGDGVVEGAEDCDDANTNSNDACVNCRDARCGDGVVWNTEGGSEACDDGDANDNNDCTNACATATCGDGIVWDDGSGVESCDLGPNNGADGEICGVTCAPQYCGDGQVGPGEACDDGNANNSDDCLDTCELPTCGDGYTWDEGSGDEQCDNGQDNGVSPDVCRADCKLTTCGDGYFGGVEACDDGNNEDGDGCTAACSEVELCYSFGLSGVDDIPCPSGREYWCGTPSQLGGDHCSQATALGFAVPACKGNDPAQAVLEISLEPNYPIGMSYDSPTDCTVDGALCDSVVLSTPGTNEAPSWAFAFNGAEGCGEGLWHRPEVFESLPPQIPPICTFDMRPAVWTQSAGGDRGWCTQLVDPSAGGN